MQQGEELMERCGFTPLQVEKTQRDSARGGKITVDFTDLVNAKNVLRPVYVQPHFKRKGVVLYNPFVT